MKPARRDQAEGDDGAQDAPAVAVPAGLVYVSDAMPGHRRVRRGASFAYRRPDGRWLTDAAELARIRRLAIPPAYTDVWICPLPHGHLQATGRDARGRKQYRYHADWSAERGDSKYARLEAFGRALPRIRARVARDLRGAGPGGRVERAQLLATLVRLLDTTFVRVGNESYARENGSYGLTTLRSEHAGVRGGRLRLRFRGKSGVQHEVAVEDPRVARVVRRCQQLPGQELFAYEDEDGTVRGVGSGDVNDYLAEAAGTLGERFTAKDFRTWHGSVQALELMRSACAPAPPATKTAAAALCAQVVREVAGRLGNTAAVCRKAYVHPAVLALAQPLGDKTAEAAAGFDWSRLETGPAPARGLQAAERRLLRLLATGRREATAARATARRGPRGRTAPGAANPLPPAGSGATEDRARSAGRRAAASPTAAAAPPARPARRDTGLGAQAAAGRARSARTTTSPP